MDHPPRTLRPLNPPAQNECVIAAFDLDETLINGDSDRLWGDFLAARGYGPTDLRAQHAHYHRLYQEGRLDINDFLKFQLGTLADRPMEQLQRWRTEYVEQCIRPRLLPAARRLIQKHRELNHRLLIITATNRFLTEPIAALYGISELLATEPEILDGRYSGRICGPPCFSQGKVTHMLNRLDGRSEDLNHAWFYTDSHNDLPLLQKVGRPVAVDPDPALQSVAEREGWPVISLRTPACDA